VGSTGSQATSGHPRAVRAALNDEGVGRRDHRPTGDRGARADRAIEDADDGALMWRVREGDAAAFATLYDRYAPQIYGLTRAVLRDDRLAEEATHDVFLNLWQRPQVFERGQGAFVGWLLRIARNRAIDLLRRRREQPFAVPSGAGGESPDVAGWLVDPDPDPADQAISLLAGRDVHAALARLAPDHRRLLELAYFGGLSQSEIAAQLDRPLGTVKTQIRTAMQRLADLLDEWNPSPNQAGGRPR
jgi:RNA polymerase sigma-70 factor (ECF subfamily)